MGSVEFATYDSTTGAPKTGLTPSWSVAFDARDGSAVASPPAISELGSGVYQFDDIGPDDLTGLIDCGATASPRWIFFAGAIFTTFAAFSALAPKTGLTPTWSALIDPDTGTAYTPQPAISELGGGVYKVAKPSDEDQALIGIIDLGATASPRYLLYDSDAVSIRPISSGGIRGVIGSHGIVGVIDC